MCAKFEFNTIIYTEVTPINHFPQVNPLVPGLKLLEKVQFIKYNFRRVIHKMPYFL